MLKENILKLLFQGVIMTNVARNPMISVNSQNTIDVTILGMGL